MKRVKRDVSWYNTRDKEIGGILLESRAAMARYDTQYPDVWLGPRLPGGRPGIHTTIL